MKNKESIRDDKKVKGGCIPVRRKISSGGKEGSYADPRTGGKQAYLALKEAKPPGSAGGWTKKNCICCHKCKNDRSAPNGFVCMNPAHLYWGSKADNTYDQNRGNGWAAENKNKIEERVNHKGEKIMRLTRKDIRSIVSEAFEMMGPPSVMGSVTPDPLDEYLAKIARENNLGMDQEGEFIKQAKMGIGLAVEQALQDVMIDSEEDFGYDDSEF